jgi:heme-degrading monooxygenase HmoA
VSDLFVYLWAYRVSANTRDEFQELYGPDGSWADLFRQAPGYVDTELLRDRDDSDRFITIDRWESEEAFLSFRASFAEEFDHLDRFGERLTIEETPLGEFGRPLMT